MLSPTELLQSYDYSQSATAAGGADAHHLHSDGGGGVCILGLPVNDPTTSATADDQPPLPRGYYASPVRGSTRQVFHLLATALCQSCEPQLASVLRRTLAASLNFKDAPSSLSSAASGVSGSAGSSRSSSRTAISRRNQNHHHRHQQQSQQQPSSELATITALDIPETLRFFPVEEAATRLAFNETTGDLPGSSGPARGRGGGGGATRCEQLIASRLRELHFPRTGAKLLVQWQLERLLGGWITQAADRLFERFFSASSSEGLTAGKNSMLRTSSCSRSSCCSTDCSTATVTVSASVTAAAASGDNSCGDNDTGARSSCPLVNTDGSNSYRPPQNQRQQQQQQLTPASPMMPDRGAPAAAPAATYAASHQQQHQQRHQQQHQQQHPQRLCRLHASGKPPAAGEPSCAACSARHFLQLHLSRISREPESLAKLERTLEDCLQLQCHWRRSLQWIAANVKESRLPEFVRPLVTCCSEDQLGGGGRSLTVNPQIIITTDGHVSAKCNWDKKKKAGGQR